MRGKKSYMLVIIAAIALVFAGVDLVKADPYDYTELKGYWQFEEGSGSTAHDTKLPDDYGTVSDTANMWTTGQVGDYALEFDGSADYVQMINESTYRITDYLTVSAWVNIDLTAMDNDIAGIVAKSDSSSLNKGYMLWFDDRASQGRTNEIMFYVFEQSNVYIAKMNEIASGWHHIVGVFDTDESGNDQVKLYIDASEGGSYVTNGSLDAIGTNDFPIRIGRDSGSINAYLDGMVDEVAIWNRALSQSDINQLYSSGLQGGAAPELPAGMLPVLSLVFGVFVWKRKMDSRLRGNDKKTIFDIRHSIYETRRYNDAISAAPCGGLEQ